MRACFILLLALSLGCDSQCPPPRSDSIALHLGNAWYAIRHGELSAATDQVGMLLECEPPGSGFIGMSVLGAALPPGRPPLNKTIHNTDD